MSSNSPSRQPPRVTVAGDVAATNATANAFLGTRRHSWMNASNVSTNPHIQNYLNPSHFKQIRPPIRLNLPPQNSYAQDGQSSPSLRGAPQTISPSSASPHQATLPAAPNPPTSAPPFQSATTHLAPRTQDPQNSLPSPALSAEAPPDKSFEETMNQSVGSTAQALEQENARRHAAVASRGAERSVGSGPFAPGHSFQTEGARQATSSSEQANSRQVPGTQYPSTQAQAGSTTQTSGGPPGEGAPRTTITTHAVNGAYQSPAHRPQATTQPIVAPDGAGWASSAGVQCNAHEQQGPNQPLARVQSLPNNGNKIQQICSTSPSNPPHGPSPSGAAPNFIEGVSSNVLRDGLLQNLDRLVQAYISNGDGPRRELRRSEHHRIQILRKAANEVDIFYMLVHQLVYTIFAGKIPTAALKMPNIDATRSELFNIFNARDGDFSNDFATHIAQYPPNGFIPSGILYQFQDFVMNFYPVWNQLRLEWQHRGFPALIDEIITRLKVRSMPLSIQIFNASMDLCWATEEGDTTKEQAWNLHCECWKVVEKFFRGKIHVVELNTARQQNFYGLQNIGRCYRASRAGRTQQLNNAHQALSSTANSVPIQQTQTVQPSSVRTAQGGQLGTPRAGHSGAMIPPVVQSNNYLQSCQAGGNQENLQNRPHSTQSHHNPTPPMPHGETLEDRLNEPLVPAEGVGGLQVSPPDPDRFAMHQAYLRSPLLKPHLVDGEPPTEPTYLYVSHFVLAPQPHSHGAAIQKWLFRVSDDLFNNLARTTVPKNNPLEGLFRSMSPSMQILRLRFVREPDNQTTDDLSSWAVGECFWPNGLFFMLNDEDLDPRKKLHWGRDMHVDVTSLILRGGNEIKIYCMHDEGTLPVIKARIGVESVKLATHSSIINEVISRVLPAEDVKAGIRKALGPAEGDVDDNDEIMCISSTLHVGLIDPILGASRVWGTPIRGKSCRHFEAFDLEAFLQTRPRREKNEPASADAWRCPICSADARPDVLLVDEWLQSVKDDLEQQGCWGNVRAIVVEADCSWTIKEEKSNVEKEKAANCETDGGNRASVNMTDADVENTNPSCEPGTATTLSPTEKILEKQSIATQDPEPAEESSVVERQPHQTTSAEPERKRSPVTATTTRHVDSAGFIDIDEIDSD